MKAGTRPLSEVVQCYRRLRQRLFEGEHRLTATDTRNPEGLAFWRVQPSRR